MSKSGLETECQRLMPGPGRLGLSGPRVPQVEGCEGAWSAAPSTLPGTSEGERDARWEAGVSLKRHRAISPAASQILCEGWRVVSPEVLAVRGGALEEGGPAWKAAVTSDPGAALSQGVCRLAERGGE